MSLFKSIAKAVAPVVVGGLFDKKAGDQASKATQEANQANIDMQYDFAKNALKWKAQDAKDAGLHPLAALGAQTHSPTIGAMPDTAQAQATSKTGAAIGNAIANLTLGKSQEELRNQQIRNEMLELELFKQRRNHAIESHEFNAMQNFKLGHKLDPIDEMLLASRFGRMGQPAIPNAFTPVRLQNGEVIEVPNKEIFDIELPVPASYYETSRVYGGKIPW